MINQFQVGQTYTRKSNTITITRRTDKSVWFEDWTGTELRRKIQTTGLYEWVKLDEMYNIDARALVETTVTSNEPQDTHNETTSEPTKVAVTEPKVKSLIVCDREAISDVVYFELIEAFNLKDDECLPTWCGFYRYEKPKKSMTEPCVYFVFYEHVNGRSGGNYQVKVTFLA
jgi:hypothetical protein